MTYNLADRTAANVRGVMAYQGHSVSELAGQLNVTSRTARAKYDGKSEFDISELEVLAEWLGYPASELTSPELVLKIAA